MKRGINHAHSRRADKTEWLTPPDLVKALGPFDLDPCAPVRRPWPTAKFHYTKLTNGLLMPWHGRVFCNPPYGDETALWMAKAADHGNTTSLVFARTDTDWWYHQVWQRARAVYFLKGRITFYNVDGTKGRYNAGAPSALVAHGAWEARRLRDAPLAAYGYEGHFVPLR